MSATKIKKITLLILTVAILLTLMSAFTPSVYAEDASGIDWDLTSGVLTIKSDVGVVRWGMVSEHYCDDIHSVIVETSVTSIDEGLLDDCTYLESITVDDNNSNYSSDINGVLFNKDKTTLIKYPGGKTESQYTVPSGVMLIGDRAFVYNCSLSSITIPASVTSIGNYAFGGMVFHFPPQRLETITFEENSQLKTMGNYAFGTCTLLKSITIPASVTSIGDHAFSNCEQLATVTFDENSQLNSISASLFSGCVSLKSITIPASVTSIEDHAFSDCGSLETVKFLSIIPPIFYCDDFKYLVGLTVIIPYGSGDAYRNTPNVAWPDDVEFIEMLPIDPLITSVTINNGVITGIDFDSYKTAILIVAFYKDNCKLLNVVTRKTNDISAINIPIPETATEFKIMIWDRFDNMSQLCNVGLVTKDSVWKSENISVNFIED